MPVGQCCNEPVAEGRMLCWHCQGCVPISLAQPSVAGQELVVLLSSVSLPGCLQLLQILGSARPGQPLWVLSSVQQL